MLNVANMPLTHVTGALLRKQQFQDPGDYDPFTSSYSIVSRAMPIIADPEFVLVSPLQEAAFALSQAAS